MLRSLLINSFQIFTIGSWIIGIVFLSKKRKFSKWTFKDLVFITLFSPFLSFTSIFIIFIDWLISTTIFEAFDKFVSECITQFLA